MRLRPWLLVLLVLLLPLRGALAAGMLCVPAGAATHAHEHVHTQAHAPTVAHDHASHHQAAAADPHPGDHHDQASASGAGQCNVCSALCSVPALVSAGPLVLAADLPAAVFVHRATAPPSFIPDGQDRPPRSI